jgi:murein DD-endopeptidase MepM/ murein hydrolase activator NlpD
MPRILTLAVTSALALLILGVACTKGPLARLTRPASPHEAYADSLRSSALDQTALGQDWLRAADRALEAAMEITLPFRESGYFPPEQAAAVAYRFELERGRTLAVEASFDSMGQGRLFVDLFRIEADAPPERLTSIPSDATTLTVTIDDAGSYLLRLQPELLRGGRYTLVQRTLASLPFPVSGATAAGINSGFGAERDAGVRQHEGVDIFASAGTPVVAVTSGVAQPSTNALGGNVVWLHDGSRRTYYYAHLERWALADTAAVKAGDVLGYVGKTGNARATAPHLHFGIYSRGAIDPRPFIAPDQETPEPPAIDLPLGSLARVGPSRSTLRRGPAPESPPLATLDRGTLLTVYAAATGRAVRVLLPDQSLGYLPRRALTSPDAPLRRRSLAAGTVLRERPTGGAPAVHVLGEAAQGDVLGRFGGYELVQSLAGSGWVDTQPAGGG